MKRRDFIVKTVAAGVVSLSGCRLLRGRAPKVAMNASTLRGYRLDFLEQVKVAVEAGYAGYEPWLRDVHAAKAAGTFAEARAIAADGGLRFINGIAFGQWVDPDPEIRKRGLEETKRDMAVLAELNCPYVAASMFGVQKPGSPVLSLPEIAERFAAVCDLGDRMGVRPLLEYWGHSVNLARLEDALKVLTFLRRSDTAVLADVYHTYRGGGDFATFATLRPAQLPILHVNDYPAAKPRTQLVDADRVWPGDGAAPWPAIRASLEAAALDPWLSLELFNPAYCTTTPVDTMREGARRLLRTLA